MSKSIDSVVNYAFKNGLSEKSKILNITHIDLDGIVSTINLFNYVDDYQNLFYVQQNYDTINDYVRNVVINGNCTFDYDFVIITDISIDEELINEINELGKKVIVLDHHQTAYHLNKFDNVYVDETETKSGADVTLDFIKLMGFEGNYLDKLNTIATQFDLFKFKNDECRKFKICDEKRSLAEMMNVLYFKTWEKDPFIQRWMDGWGNGFTKEEIKIIKTDYEKAKEHIQSLKLNGSVVQLDDDMVLVIGKGFIVNVCEYFLDVQGNSLVIIYDPQRMKFSGRVNDNSNINIGKIFQLLKENKEYVTNGGGHEKAGGGNLTSNDFLDEFVEKVVKLANHLKKTNDKY